MKCRLEGNKICKRCRQSGVQCVFVPRANAARTPSTSSSTSATVLQRLAHIETLLGINESTVDADTERVDSEDEIRENDGQNVVPQDARYRAVEDLRRLVPGCANAVIWRHDLVRELWSR